MTSSRHEIGDLVEHRSVVVSCGSGGVGKTTVAAAFALEAARRGRRACVVTIDPARRLADALGLDTLTNTPKQIEGPWPGELWALMLDSKGTFDDLVRRYATSSEQAEGILANRIYRNLTGALSGTQEYMAMEKLYELAEEGAYDIVVVDTPPTRNAIDFLEAPRRLTRFLGHRLFQLLLMPTRAYLRAVSVAAQALLRTISNVA
ncbi:MAG: ArsA-related P-loop ATPase, partial [Acidimicrobiales bacterium]